MFQGRKLAVQTDVVQDGRRGSFGVVTQHRTPELIVQAQTHFLQGQVRIDVLPKDGGRRAAVAVIGVEIFGFACPVPGYGKLHAGACRPARTPLVFLEGIAARELRQRELVESPGEAARGVKEPVAGSITDARSRRAGSDQRIAIAAGAERRR